LGGTSGLGEAGRGPGRISRPGADLGVNSAVGGTGARGAAGRGLGGYETRGAAAGGVGGAATVGAVAGEASASAERELSAATGRPRASAIRRSCRTAVAMPIKTRPPTSAVVPATIRVLP